MTAHRIGAGICIFFFWTFIVIWVVFNDGVEMIAAPGQASASDWVLPGLALASIACGVAFIVRAPDQE